MQDLSPASAVPPESVNADNEASFQGRDLIIPRDPLITKGRRRRDLRLGLYELKEVDAIRRMVTPQDVVLELGGGIGYVSTLLSKVCGAKAVHTFEANPALLPYMAQMHALNDAQNVTIHHALLSATPTPPKPFYVRRNFLASSMDPNGGPYEREVAIEVRPLADTLREIQPSFLVCDIEGAEATLLPAGDWSDLQGAVIELHPQWIGSDGVAAVFEAMQRAGLTYFPRSSNAKVVAFKRTF